MKIKKSLLALTLLMFFILTFTSCSPKKYSAEEMYGARAAYTISRHIGEAVSFVITYIEYSENEDDIRITADCALYYSGSEFKRFVFAVGEGSYFEEKTEQGSGIFDEETKLYMLNFGDTILNKSDENKLDQKIILELYGKFTESGDKTLLGME